MLLRIYIALVLSIVHLTTSACASINPVADMSGNNLIEDDTTTKEIRKLAEGGSETAQTRLALRYLAGEGLPQNYRQAKKWFEEAAKQGNAEAQVNLGTLYFRGEGAPRSAQMALFWFSRAAAQGDAAAFVKLGQMYAEAQGVPRDLIQAHMWFHLAATTGDVYSAEKLDALALKMSPAQLTDARERAREWRPTNKSVTLKFRTHFSPHPKGETALPDTASTREMQSDAGFGSN